MATNNVPQTQPFNPDSGLGSSVVLDLEDTFQTFFHLPIIDRTVPD